MYDGGRSQNIALVFVVGVRIRMISCSRLKSHCKGLSLLIAVCPRTSRPHPSKTPCEHASTIRPVTCTFQSYGSTVFPSGDFQALGRPSFIRGEGGRIRTEWKVAWFVLRKWCCVESLDRWESLMTRLFTWQAWWGSRSRSGAQCLRKGELHRRSEIRGMEVRSAKSTPWARYSRVVIVVFEKCKRWLFGYYYSLFW